MLPSMGAFGSIICRLWRRGGGGGGEEGNGGGNAPNGALSDNGDNADVPMIDHAVEAPARSPPRIPETEHNSEEHGDEGHPATGSFDETATLRHPSGVLPGVGSNNKNRKRAPNWEDDETCKLLICKLQSSTRDKGKAHWQAISEQIPGRTWKQCQQRWDTLLKPYFKIKHYCDTHHKQVGQVTKAELRSLGLERYIARNCERFKTIAEYMSRMPGEGSSAPSTSTVGERDLASAAPGVLPTTSTATASALDVTEPIPVARPEGGGPKAATNKFQPHLASEDLTDAMTTAEALGPEHQTDGPFSELPQLSFDYDMFLNDVTASSHDALCCGQDP